MCLSCRRVCQVCSNKIVFKIVLCSFWIISQGPVPHSQWGQLLLSLLQLIRSQWAHPVHLVGFIQFCNWYQIWVDTLKKKEQSEVSLSSVSIEWLITRICTTDPYKRSLRTQIICESHTCHALFFFPCEINNAVQTQQYTSCVLIQTSESAC